MALANFYEPAMKKRVADAIAAIEARTSAEVMLAMRPSSGTYRHSDYLVGSLCSLTSVLVFLFHPREMRIDYFAIEVVVVWLLGALLSSRLSALRRLFTSKKLMLDNVERSARSAFVELGVSRTRDRTGVLVYVSAFERRVVLVPDIALEPALGKKLPALTRTLQETLDRSWDAAAFGERLEAMGPELARAFPRRSDDEDELPNLASIS
jgi:putative membrane protein